MNGQLAQAIVFVTAAQMLCGVAKDLTKLGGKTVTKLVTPDEKQVCCRGWRCWAERLSSTTGGSGA